MRDDLKFKSKKIAIIGAGVEGISSAKWFEKHGAFVTIRDKKDGNDYLNGLDQYDLIVRSPGVKREIIEQALPKDSQTEITSQTKLFFNLCPAKIIGVTGTKGKGTTSTLIYEMLKKSGKNVYIGGNIGKPPLDFLDILNTQDWVVLELSSFQLYDLKKSPGPHIAVMLMTTSEHLDWHKDTYEYVDAKRNILRFQTPKDFVILNKDYVATHESDIHANGQIFQVSTEREVAERGCFVRDGKIVVKGIEVAHENFVSSPHKVKDIEIIATKDIFIPGRHNWENACAASMAATLAGVSKEDIAYVLKTFKGLEHRLELVATIGDVRYYDDSFSTTPETAIAAIEAFKEPEVLILGGSGKNSDFTELGRVISSAKNVKAIIGVGQEWPRIKSQLPITNYQLLIVENAKDMKQIVAAASKIAQPGDVVLLSPACASFDMFKNYKERGEQFKEEVQKLA